MTAGYATQHASASALIRQKGTNVTFTLATATHDPSTGTFSAPGTVTVTGAAIRVRGNPVAYQALGLIELHPATLLFAPDTYGERPALGSTVSWEGATRTVKSVDPVAPDGTDILSRVIVA